MTMKLQRVLVGVIGVLAMLTAVASSTATAQETPAPTPAPSYQVLQDLTFTKKPLPLKLDAHIPTGKGPFPAIILVHGGGWTGGDKQANFIQPLFPVLDRTGYAWFSIDYRLAPAFPYTAMVEDVENAIRYVKSNARLLKVDRKKIVLMGESAGAHLVNLVGARNRKPVDVAAVVSFYGPINMEKLLNFPADPAFTVPDNIKSVFGMEANDEKGKALLRAGSPDTYLNPQTPPFLFIHGTKDEAVAYEQATMSMELFKKNNLSADLITVQDGIHGVINWESDPKFQGYKTEMIEWLKRTLDRKPQPATK
jgi:alpha-L-fucosidase 2